MKYLKEAKFLWQTYVPQSGQADTVQGELIRAIEKLRYETLGNGNINWDNGHETLVRYIEETLLESNVFKAKEQREIKNDIKKLLDYEYPSMEEEIYDRITDRIVEWYFQNKEPIRHNKNPNLHR